MKRRAWVEWLTVTGLALYAAIMVVSISIGWYGLLQDANTRPPGQNIGGGITTTCHGLNRLYMTRAGGITVVHGDATCHTGG